MQAARKILNTCINSRLILSLSKDEAARQALFRKSL
jgi:hypothetical protein